MWRLADLAYHSCRGSATHYRALLHAGGGGGVGMKKGHILGDLEERHSDIGCISAAEPSQMVTHSETSL